MRNLYNLSDLCVQEIFSIIRDAEAFKNGNNYYCGGVGKIVANIFFEPSTRTQYSFNTAELKLDCKIINFNPECSSLKKGETFYDTVKTFECFGTDALVIRHSENEYYHQLRSFGIPVINAGDGTGNHPTQSLLDLMTIKEEFGGFEGLKIAIIGDIRHSRVAHTNIEVMTRLGMDVYTSGPEELSEGCFPYIEFDKAVREMDVIMLLRVQHERHDKPGITKTSNYNQSYGLTVERVAKMKPGAIIMHPAPFNREVEISNEVVECSKSRIFRQIQNGVFVRMAVLKRAFEE